MLENFMNDPVDNHGVAYKQYDYKTGVDFVYCPHCGKKQFPVTDIKRKYYKCKSKKCGKGYEINIKK